MSESKQSLTQRAGKGMAWMILMRWSVRALGLVSTVILARLLEPEDYGVAAMAAMVVGFIEVFGMFGFQ